ncbi:MAG: tRNA lysidine(34) synthetase TilS, partial [Phycisphaeraceae bacterium]|nr:tRNA lysidine(34) synthetase TilS [Phycisphaeraceae bacterium]
RHPFVKAIVDGLSHECDVSPNSQCLIALSGGADSVALLRGMHVIAQRRKWQLHLVVGHVQHHLRTDAEADAQFCEALANQLDLPFERRDIAIDPALGNVEDMARQLRYDALIDMAKQHQCTHIVTAHHGLDQLETMLMRLVRGTSLRGLGAMSWTRSLTDDITLIRPMLKTDHAMAMALLQSIHQPWCEDQTNTDTTRLRAAIRQRVIPVLLDLRDDLPQQVVQTADQLRLIQAMLDEQCMDAMRACQVRDDTAGVYVRYCRKQLRELPPAMLQMVLRAILTQVGVRPDRLGAKQLSQFGKMLIDQDGSERQLIRSRHVSVLLNRDNLTCKRT